MTAVWAAAPRSCPGRCGTPCTWSTSSSAWTAATSPRSSVSDTGSYSDVVFGLLELLGISYRPALADLPDQKGWRIKGDADYGP